MGKRETAVLFREFSRWGFDERGWSPRTRYKYVTIARRADEWLRTHKKTSLPKATPLELKAWLFQTPATARTRNQLRCALVAVFDFFLATGRSAHNPAAAIKRIRELRSLPRPVEATEAADIQDAAAAFPPMVRFAAVLLLYTGLRKTEARTLEWSQIGSRWIRVIGKGGKERHIPLPDELLPWISSWRAQCPSKRLVFPSPRYPERVVGDTWFGTKIREIGSLARVPVTPHVLRHTYATRLLDLGEDIRVIQYLLGHECLATTEVYTKVKPQRALRAATKLSYRDAPEFPAERAEVGSAGA